jgi:hypothetical protein
VDTDECKNLLNSTDNLTTCATSLVSTILNDGLHELCIDPFTQYINKGTVVPLVTKMRDMTNYLAYTGRDKVVRAVMNALRTECTPFMSSSSSSSIPLSPVRPSGTTATRQWRESRSCPCMLLSEDD